MDNVSQQGASPRHDAPIHHSFIRHSFIRSIRSIRLTELT